MMPNNSLLDDNYGNASTGARQLSPAERARRAREAARSAAARQAEEERAAREPQPANAIPTPQPPAPEPTTPTPPPAAATPPATAPAATQPGTQQAVPAGVARGATMMENVQGGYTPDEYARMKAQEQANERGGLVTYSLEGGGQADVGPNLPHTPEQMAIWKAAAAARKWAYSPDNPASGVRRRDPGEGWRNGAEAAAKDPRAAGQGTADAARAAAKASVASIYSAPTQAYGPGNDLRGTQINGVDTPVTREQIAATNLEKARAAIAAMQGRIPGLEQLAGQGVAAGTYNTSAEAERARALTMQGMEGLYTSPDRMELALQALQLAQEQEAPAYQQRLREVGQKAAALGRVGAGMTTNDLTGVEQDYTTKQAQLKRQLILDASQQTMADQLARLGATQSVGGQFRGEDMQEAGFQRGLRDEGRAELDRRFGLGSALAGMDLSRAGTEAQFAGIERGDAESDRGYNFNADEADFARAARSREEMRGERSYQEQMAQTGLNNRVEQLRLEEELMNSEFMRRLQQAQAQMGAGGSGDDYIRALLLSSQG